MRPTRPQGKQKQTTQAPLEYQGRKARRSRKPRAWASHLSRRSRPINDHNFTPNRVLGGNTEPPDKQEFDLIHSETINITSAAKNQDSLLSRNATITTFQEHGLNANQLKTLQALARQGKKDWREVHLTLKQANNPPESALSPSRG